MLGDKLLVAPIMNAEGIGEYYLPAGEWVNITTNEERTGGKWYKEHYDYLTMPLFKRKNSKIVENQ